MEKRITELLVCPLCKGELHYDREAEELICRFDKLAYPVCDGIPMMTIKQARDTQKKAKAYKKLNKIGWGSEIGL
jgi:uncharacterized protein